MAEKETAIIVHPIAGLDFRIVPNGVAMTVRYYAKVDAAPDDEAQPSFTTEALTVGLTAAQAKDVANSLQRAAQMIESNPEQSTKPPV
jgi:hypothetical protein